MIASLPSSPLSPSPPPLLHLLSFFSVCMTNSKEIPNCGRRKPAAPPPAFSWQDGSCLTFNHECFARQLGLQGDSVGGTVETWSGEAGSVQLNLFIKTQEPGHNNTIIIVPPEKTTGSDLFLVRGLRSGGKKSQNNTESFFKKASRALFMAN